ncbi:hypothetical protein XH90_09575 [Bradyrhizobium sp. CCBAU 53338]|nr:hypothetical protein XH90_09575 [Bradyrhizobium sp. CCBAU 53338]
MLGKKHGLSLVGVGRQVEATKAFKKYAAENAVAVADLILAIGMKTYNQSPATFIKKFLILLSGTPSPNDLLKWYEQFSGGLKSGVGAATELSSFWSDWCKTNPGSLRDQIQAQMLASCLLNPCALSKSNGWYVLSKQVFESPSRFTAFVSALGQGKDYVDAILFDAKTGAIRNDPRTDRLRPGLLVKKKLGYVWDAAGNAYRLDNDDWTAVPVSQINIKKL